MFASVASSLKKLSPLALAGVAIFLTSCSSSDFSRFRQPWLGLVPAAKPGEVAPSQKRQRAPKYNWNDEQVAGRASITIDLAEQRAYFLRGNTVVGESDISTGRSGYDTPPGDYRVIQKDKNHRSTLYGDFVDGDGDVVQANADLTKQRTPRGLKFLGAKMPYFLRFYEGYGLHAGHLPGRPASHGCVRLPLIMAERFYENAPLGTPVAVLP